MTSERALALVQRYACDHRIALNGRYAVRPAPDGGFVVEPESSNDSAFAVTSTGTVIAFQRSLVAA